MNRNFIKIYIFVAVFFSDFVMFAQPEDNDDDGTLEDGDAAAVPINGKLIWLAIIGILFAIYVYRNNRKEA